LSVLGYVLNRVSNENSLAADTNREVLSSLTGIQCLGELPFTETAETRKKFPLDQFEKEFDIRLIARFLAHR
jgi:dethiobiotin synthetase